MNSGGINLGNYPLETSSGKTNFYSYKFDFFFCSIRLLDTEMVRPTIMNIMPIDAITKSFPLYMATIDNIDPIQTKIRQTTSKYRPSLIGKYTYRSHV